MSLHGSMVKKRPSQSWRSQLRHFGIRVHLPDMCAPAALNLKGSRAAERPECHATPRKISFFCVTTCHIRVTHVPISQMECVVCLEATAGYLVPCGHPVCKSCMFLWSAQKVLCPYCLQVPCYHHPHVDTKTLPSVPMGIFDGHGKKSLGVTVASPHGVVTITRVEPGQMCHAVGLRRGDAILRVNGFIVTSHQTALAIMQRCIDCHVSLTVWVVHKAEEPTKRTRAWRAVCRLFS